MGTSQDKSHNKNEILKVSVSACQSSKLTFLSLSTSVSAMAPSIINFSVKISHQPSTSLALADVAIVAMGFLILLYRAVLSTEINYSDKMQAAVLQ